MSFRGVIIKEMLCFSLPSYMTGMTQEKGSGNCISAFLVLPQFTLQEKYERAACAKGSSLAALTANLVVQK